MTNKTELRLMTNAEVSAAQKIATSTTRARIRRKTRGESSPEFPAPLRKVNGGWVWDQDEVEQFLEEQALS